MMKLILAILLLSLSFVNDVPTEASREQASNFESKTVPFDEKYERVVTSSEKDKRFIVNYEIKDQDIYVECFVKDFSFNKKDIGSVKKEGEGHIHLYVNGNKVDSIFRSSFIIKSLPSGTYTIKLELVHNDYTPYGISEEFEITL